jgi:hypothetical protein|tara:strand:- start:1013 stop:1219 length:207 start_codon:yes stop_codon:yes gene_type:complete
MPGLEEMPIPDNGKIEQPSYTELADGADAVTPQTGKKGLDTFAIPDNGKANTTFGDGTAGSNPNPIGG